MLSYTEASKMTWAQLKEANEAFNELLSLKEKQAEEQRELMKKNMPKIKLKRGRR